MIIIILTVKITYKNFRFAVLALFAYKPSILHPPSVRDRRIRFFKISPFISSAKPSFCR